jgi:DNA-binding IclR family transcriptional regulator
MLKVNADAYARLIGFLSEDRPRGYSDLVDLTGLHYTTVRDYVNALRRHRQVYVARWMPDSRNQFRIPMFLLGHADDAVRPRMTAAQRQQSHRARERAAAGLPPKSYNPRPKKLPVNSVFALAA